MQPLGTSRCQGIRCFQGSTRGQRMTFLNPIIEDSQRGIVYRREPYLICPYQ